MTVGRPRTPQLYGLIALALTFVIAIGWQLASWRFLDDFTYLRIPGNDGGYDIAFWEGYRPFLNGFADIPRAVANHWLSLNGRLANLIYIIAAQMPVPVIRLLIGLGIGLFAWLCLLVGGGRRVLCRPLTVTVGLVLFWFVFQWSDGMESADFQFNYTFGGLLMLIVIIGYFRSPVKPRWFWVALVIFAPWHEGYTVTMLAVIAIAYFGGYRRDAIRVSLILILGLIFICSPGTVSRAGDSWNVGLGIRPFYNEWYGMTAPLVSLVWWRIARRRLSAGRHVVDIAGWSVVASAIVGFAFYFFVSAASRCFWPTDVLTLCLILRLLPRRRFSSRYNTAFGCCLLAAYTVWGASLVYWQNRVSAQDHVIYEQLTKGSPLVYIDEPIRGDEIPFWLMGIVHTYPDYDPVAPTMMCNVATRSAHETFVVLPTELRDRPFESWPRIPGTTSFRGQWPYVVARGCDSTLVGCHFGVTVGEPTNAMTPLNVMLSTIRTGDYPGLDSDRLIVRTVTPIVHQGDTLSLITFYPPRRTIGRREFLFLDTNPETTETR